MLAIFDDGADRLGPKVIGLYTALIIVNLLAWVWALASFRSYPLLLATAPIAYGFGLRHAVDADHIAAIDNVTPQIDAGRQAADHDRVLLLARPL